MEKLNIKEEARKLIDQLPENCTWDYLMYKIYVRQVIDAGLGDSDVGRVMTLEDLGQNLDCRSKSFLNILSQK